MQIFESKSEYINTIKSRIKWKRAKEIAVMELSDHIDDQYEEFLDNGYKKSDALSKALNEMGDANEIGDALNSVYKPKINWRLILITVLFLITGFILRSFAFLNSYGKYETIGLLIGILGVIVTYFVDYTIILKRPKTIFWAYTVLTGISIILEKHLFYSIIQHHYSFYFLLFYPIVLAGILLYIKNGVDNLQFEKFVFFSLVPLTYSLILHSLTAFFYLYIIMITFLIYAINNNWIEINKKQRIIGIGVFILLAIIIIVCNTSIVRLDNTVNIHDLYSQKQVSDIIRNAPLIGKYDGEFKYISDYWNDYPITFLVAKYGTVSIPVVLLLYSILLYCLYKTIIKQNTDVGYLISLSVFIIFSLQLIVGLLCNLGIIGGYFMIDFPLFPSGGSYLIFNLILIGVMLSISRNQEIAKEWIKLNETSNYIEGCGKN